MIVTLQLQYDKSLYNYNSLFTRGNHNLITLKIKQVWKDDKQIIAQECRSDKFKKPADLKIIYLPKVYFKLEQLKFEEPHPI